MCRTCEWGLYKLLLDDDLFHHERSKNDEILLTLENISFVTSYRELIDENGEILPPSTLNMKIAKETTLLKEKN